jgi:hypothetical protein
MKLEKSSTNQKTRRASVKPRTIPRVLMINIEWDVYGRKTERGRCKQVYFMDLHFSTSLDRNCFRNPDNVQGIGIPPPIRQPNTCINHLLYKIYFQVSNSISLSPELVLFLCRSGCAYSIEVVC